MVALEIQYMYSYIIRKNIFFLSPWGKSEKFIKKSLFLLTIAATLLDVEYNVVLARFCLAQFPINAYHHQLIE